MGALLRAVSDAVVAIAGFLIDALAGTRPHDATEGLPDSATLVARFRAQPSSAPAAAATPPAASAPVAASAPSRASSTDSTPPPSDAPAAAPATSASPDATPATAATAAAPAPAAPTAAGSTAPLQGSIDRAAFEALHLAPTPAAQLTPEQELLEASPAHGGAIDRAQLTEFLARHHDGPNAPAPSPEAELLPSSPARSGTIDQQALQDAHLQPTPAAQPNAALDRLLRAPVLITAGRPPASANPAPVPIHAAPATVHATPAATAETHLPAPDPAATQPQAHTWPELPVWPVQWDEPVTQRAPLRERLETTWYV